MFHANFIHAVIILDFLCVVDPTTLSNVTKNKMK